MKKLVYTSLVLILLLAGFLRLFKITQNPPSISWDEAAVGYNAWTILNWGEDEWGKTMPLVFKSFADYKHPVHVYFTVPTVAIFGLNELGVRSSSAIFGILNVLILFFLAKKLFNSDLAGLIASFVLAISPYNIHFSRFNHELNFALFFFMLGFYLVLKGIEKKNYLLILGFASLGLDLLTYHSSKVMVPPTVLLILILYFKELIKNKKIFVYGLLSLSLFVSLLFVEPNLLGGARLKQTTSGEQMNFISIKDKYLKHFTYEYLITKGDSNPRLSAQSGTFYKVDIPFFIIGFIFLLLGIIKRKKSYVILFSWMVLSPIPSAITIEAPHAARAMFMTGSFHLVIALGIYKVMDFVKNIYLKFFAGLLILSCLVYSLIIFWKSYFGEYRDRYAIEWQYGMKQIVNYVLEDQNIYKVYMDPIRQQPYIFFLFYMKTPLPEFLRTVKYEESEAKSYNTVHSFDNYQFGGWNLIESYPGEGILYVVTPSYYTGLRYREKFNTMELVKYPDKTDAFYLEEGHEQ